MQINENMRRKGLAKELFKDLLKEHGDKNIILSPLKPDGADFFSSIIGRKIKPSLTQDADIIKGVERQEIKLSKNDIKNAKVNLKI